MKFKNKTYNKLKWIATIVIPAIQTFWIALGQIWCIPCTNEIALTIAAVGVLIGACIGISTSCYNKMELCEEEKVIELECEVENDE